MARTWSSVARLRSTPWIRAPMDGSRRSMSRGPGSAAGAGAVVGAASRVMGRTPVARGVTVARTASGRTERARAPQQVDVAALDERQPHNPDQLHEDYRSGRPCSRVQVVTVSSEVARPARRPGSGP